MRLRVRRLVLMLAAFLGVGVWVVTNPASYEVIFTKVENDGADYVASEAEPGAETEANVGVSTDAPLAMEVLERLEVKGRAPKNGYKREQHSLSHTRFPLLHNESSCS